MSAPPKVVCAHAKLVPTSKLKPNEGNPNVHSKAQLELYAKILLHQGWRRPIVVSKQSGLIVTGHGAWLTAKAQGWKDCPVDVQNFRNRADETAHMIADNKLPQMAEFDEEALAAAIRQELEGDGFDLDLTGLSLDEQKKLDVGVSVEEETPIDQSAENLKKLRAKWGTEAGQLWEFGEHRVLCGDCTNADDVRLVTNGKPVALCFASPPYADLRNYQGGKDLEAKSLAKVLDFPASVFCINLGLIIRDREVVQYWNDYLAAAKERNLDLLAWCVWDKGNASAPAHQQAMFGLCHEWVFVFGEYRELNLTNPNKSPGADSWGECTVRNGDNLVMHSKTGKTRTHRQLDTVIRLQAQKNYSADYTDHPAQFPIGLPTKFIEAITNPDEVVADPFLGSGTTLIACENLGRRCRGIEIEPAYVAVTLERWATLTGKTPKLCTAKRNDAKLAKRNGDHKRTVATTTGDEASR